MVRTQYAPHGAARKNHRMVKRSDSGWPRPQWFMRTRLLDRCTLAAAIIAIAMELVHCVQIGEQAWSYAFVGLSISGVALGRVWPRTGFLLTLAASVLAVEYSTEYTALWTVVVFSLFSVAIRGGRVLWLGIIGTSAIYLSVVHRANEGFAGGTALVLASVTALSATTGVAVRSQRRYYESLVQRTRDAETARESEVEKRLAEERLRIARDLHDAVGHEIAVVGMSLGVAEVRLGEDVGATRAALGSARAGIQRVLQETQQILDILRRGETEASVVDPVAELAAIGSLVDSVRSAGSPVDATLRLGDGDVAPSVSVAAYRVVQEALTNAQRHGVGTITLAVVRDGDRIVIDMVNQVKDGAAPGSRYGLIGMRERVESAGGRLSAVQDGERFQVHAELNVRGEPG